jgi:hypothetical protein
MEARRREHEKKKEKGDSKHSMAKPIGQWRREHFFIYL